MGTDFSKLGRYLRLARQEAGLSQGMAARHFGWTTPQYVSNIERGLCPPPPKMLKKIVQLYKLNSPDLVYALLMDIHSKEYKKALGIK